MDNENLYNELLKNLRVALTNVSVYFKEHPIFIRSIQELKVKLDELLLLSSPLRIGVTTESLLFNGQHFEGAKFYKEIIELFHIRKVKTIEIKKGVPSDELVTFLIQSNLPPKDILIRGGLSNILKEAGLKYIRSEDLDYSQFLSGQGKETKDIWLHLLDVNLKQENYARVDQLTPNFSKALQEISIKDLSEDKKAKEVIIKFLSYLEKKDKAKFLEYSKGLAKSILSSGGMPQESDINNLKEFLKDLDAESLSSMLLENFKEDAKVDLLNLGLFSKLLNTEEHKEVAHALSEKIEAGQLKNNPKVQEGVKELLSCGDSNISKVYNYNLASILENISLGKGISFDTKSLEGNYRLILLDLLIAESDLTKCKFTLDKILVELDKQMRANDFDYLKNFMRVSALKRKELPAIGPIWQNSDNLVNNFLEEAMFREDVSAELEYFINTIASSNLDAEFYLDKIFKEGKLNPCILKTFFKLFAESADSFYVLLSKKGVDVIFMKKLIESLKTMKVETESLKVFVLEILKIIFSSANKFIKIEVLKLMQQLQLSDEKFLLSLLGVTNPFGIRTKVIEDNLSLFQGLVINGAKEHLVKLSRYKFFWNRNIRRNAKQFLEKYG